MRTEKNVLMKCETCHYQEDVPFWVLEELHFKKLDPLMLTKEVNTCCPNCNRTMYPVNRIDK